MLAIQPGAERPEHPAGAVRVANDDSILADVIGERPLANEKGACRVARRIEETLIAKGWPHGKSWGSEQALAESFGIGRAIVREAVRILEVRGTARMVRGPGGGLKVLEMDRRRTADFLIGFALFAGLAESQLVEAERILGRVRSNLPRRGLARARSVDHQCTDVLDFFDEVIRALREVMSDDEAVRSSVLLSPAHLRRSRAGQIAERMLLECTAEQWASGHRLGSEEDLCFRYGADRDTFRQAVRILESAGAAETLCGRGHGLFSQAPRTGTIARLVSCLFASSHIHPRAVMRVFQELTVEIVATAAIKASPEDCERVSRSLDRLEEGLGRQDSSSILSRVFEVEEAIVAVAANPILQLFAQSLRGYPSIQIPRNLALLEAMNRQFLTLSRPILDAFRANSAGAAAVAQRSRAAGLALVSTAIPGFASDTKRH